MISPAEKAELLGRLDRLEQAVRKARMRGNCAEVVDAHIGNEIKRYLLEGQLSDK